MGYVNPEVVARYGPTLEAAIRHLLDALPEPEDLFETLLRLLARPAVFNRHRGISNMAESGKRPWQSHFQSSGDLVLVVGALLGEVRGSEYLAMRELVVERPPRGDPAREQAVHSTVHRAWEAEILSSVQNCSSGGLAMALAECCLAINPHTGDFSGSGLGAALRVPFPLRRDFILFGEEVGRAVVSLSHTNLPRLQEIARECGAPLIPLGIVGGDRLEIQNVLSVNVAELAQAWDGSRAALGQTPQSV